MQTKPAPWNLNNSNVMILAGPWFELVAIKYGLCITENRKKLLPCKYIAIYENDTIKHLFEINSLPLDNASLENTNEIRNIKDNDPKIFEEWFSGKEVCRLFHINKDADVGPIVNDYVSPTTGKLAPLTRGTPRYTTYQKLLGAKLTSQLECSFDDEEVYEEPVIVPEPEPEPDPKKFTFLPWLIGAGIVAVLIIGYLMLNQPEPEPKITKQDTVYVKQKPPKLAPLSGSGFEQGSAKLKESSEPILENVLKTIQAYPNARIVIVGHTDNVGNEEANKELSEQRALSVRKWFVEHGFHEEKISHKGMGSLQPIADNDSEEGRAKNRRTEIKIILD